MALSKNDNRDMRGGLNAKNIKEINIRFICEVCKFILLDPYQLLCCGALLCRWCYRKRLSNNEPFVCPSCHKEQAKKEARPDRGTERELKIIIIVCYSYSCPWNGTYKDYLDHLQQQHADLECHDCHERFFALNSFEEHLQELCIHRRIPCGLPDCSDLIKWDEMLSHYLSDKHQQLLLLIISEYFKSKDQHLQTQNYAEFMNKEVNDLEENIEIVKSSCESLSTDVIRMEDERSQIKTNLEQNVSKIDELKKQDNEKEKSIKELSDNQNRIQTDCDHIKKATEKRLIQILDTNSTVTLVFIYPNTPTFSLISPRFKTSEYGYEFLLRVCSTNGYVSVFITLCDSEYSNLLPYPFTYKIHLILWDQSNQQKHIMHILKPNLHSPALDRPTSGMNDEFGINQFCPLPYLTDEQSSYVKDGKFFIRIFIDFLDTGLNPFQLKDNTQDNETITTTSMITE